MTNPSAAQDRCPTRTDLQHGLRLIAEDPEHTRIFNADKLLGLSESPVDARGQMTHFSDLPSWLGVSSPHAILPGVIDGPKGKATVTYYLDRFYADDAGSFDPDYDIPALFDDLFSRLNIGDNETFEVSVDQGTWRMMGLAIWNKSDGVLDVTFRGPSPMSPHKLGQCEYDIATYRINLRTGTQTLLFEDVHYAPNLGLILGRSRLANNGTPVETYWFSNFAYLDAAPRPNR